MVESHDVSYEPYLPSGFINTSLYLRKFTNKVVNAKDKAHNVEYTTL